MLLRLISLIFVAAMKLPAKLSILLRGLGAVGKLEAAVVGVEVRLRAKEDAKRT